MSAHLYSCRAFGPDQFAVTKFDRDLNPEATYSTNLAECDCPAGHRPTCRHRQMLQKFLADRHIDDGWFLNWDTRQWQPAVGLPGGPRGLPYSEEDCPGHIASKDDSKVCMHCGCHIDSMRPPEDDELNGAPDVAAAASAPSAGAGHDTPPAPQAPPPEAKATTKASGGAFIRRRI